MKKIIQSALICCALLQGGSLMASDTSSVKAQQTNFSNWVEWNQRYNGADIKVSFPCPPTAIDFGDDLWVQATDPKTRIKHRLSASQIGPYSIEAFFGDDEYRDAVAALEEKIYEHIPADAIELTGDQWQMDNKVCWNLSYLYTVADAEESNTADFENTLYRLYIVYDGHLLYILKTESDILTGELQHKKFVDSLEVN